MYFTFKATDVDFSLASLAVVGWLAHLCAVPMVLVASDLVAGLYWWPKRRFLALLAYFGGLTIVSLFG